MLHISWPESPSSIFKAMIASQTLLTMPSFSHWLFCFPLLQVRTLVMTLGPRGWRRQSSLSWGQLGSTSIPSATILPPVVATVRVDDQNLPPSPPPPHAHTHTESYHTLHAQKHWKVYWGWDNYTELFEKLCGGCLLQREKWGTNATIPWKLLTSLDIVPVKGRMPADNGLSLAENPMHVSYLEVISLRNYLHQAKGMILYRCLYYLFLCVSQPPLQLVWGCEIELWSIGDEQRSPRPGPSQIFHGTLHLFPCRGDFIGHMLPESELTRWRMAVWCH